jgi:4-amino-4-deoxy-L-arabinose transferase-like glycosyltransferase
VGGGAREGRLAAIGLAILAAGLLSIRLNEPGWFDNEGRYAESAREMVVLADYVTPRVNYFPHLTKPPLTAWLAALVYWVTGPSEWARLVSIVAAALTIILTCRLGALLYDVPTGLVAGIVLATTIGFDLEARTLRPDCLVILAVTAVIFCWWNAEVGPPARRLPWLVAMYATLGIGMLAKGMVAPLLAAAPIGLASLQAHGFAAAIRRLRPVLGLAIVAAVILPWHVTVALANPGFAWDYVVNEHLLFAIGRKVPKDSDADTLAFFWKAFLCRAAPWVVFLPLTIREAAIGLADGPTPRATAFLWAWILGVMVLFSLTPSRLEHYSLPALPAVALLVARFWRRATETGLGRSATCFLVLLGVAILAGGVFGLTRGPAFAADVYWLPQAPRLMALVTPAAMAACVLGVLLTVAALMRSPSAVVGATVGGVVPLIAILLQALIEAEALFSWRPIARALTRVRPETEVVFQAPIEYQNIGGLLFYVRRRMTMLEPQGVYEPPAYLEPYVDDMFITQKEFDRRWTSGQPMAIVSDPQQRRDDAQGVVPPPFDVLARFGDRWVLTNFPVADAR